MYEHIPYVRISHNSYWWDQYVGTSDDNAVKSEADTGTYKRNDEVATTDFTSIDGTNGVTSENTSKTAAEMHKPNDNHSDHQSKPRGIAMIIILWVYCMCAICICQIMLPPAKLQLECVICLLMLIIMKLNQQPLLVRIYTGTATYVHTYT